MPKRVIARKRRNGVKRFYADFRDFAPQGGTYEALKAPGERYVSGSMRLGATSITTMPTSGSSARTLIASR